MTTSPSPSPKFWTPDPQLTSALVKHCKSHNYHRILDVGPGNFPFPAATVAVGWEDLDWLNRHPGTVHTYARRDLMNEQSLSWLLVDHEGQRNFDFTYSRHTIEDLYNPIPLLEALTRCPAGYVECPSPAAELSKGVDADFNGSPAPWRGYMHHHWIVWVEDGKLVLTPKYTLAQHVDIYRRHSPLAFQKYWNVGLLWGGDSGVPAFSYKILLHERDYRMQSDYTNILSHATMCAVDQQEILYKHLVVGESSEPTEIAGPLVGEVPPEAYRDDDFGDNSNTGIHFEPVYKKAKGLPKFNQSLPTPPTPAPHIRNPMSHSNPNEDEDAIRDLATKAYQRALLGDRGGELSVYSGPPIAVEIGSWAGRTTEILASVGFRTFAIDHWLGNPDDRLGELSAAISPQLACKTFCQNMAVVDPVGEGGSPGHPGPFLTQIFPLVGSSAFWASVYPSQYLPIYFLYIDADHSYSSVLQDIILWTPHCRTGAIISGHDFNIFPGVRRAVEETGAYQGDYQLAGKSVWWRTKE